MFSFRGMKSIMKFNILSFNNYLVTGAAGFIGSHICEEIVKQGKHVIGVDNLAAGKIENLSKIIDSKYFNFVNADITNFENIIKHFNVDIVFHNACSKCTVCRIDPHKDLMVNAWGTWNVLEASRINNVKKVIHASTGSVMDGNPKSFYGASKLAGQAYLGAFKDYYKNFNYSILQYYHVYGSKQDNSINGGVIPIFIKKIYNNEPVTIEGDGKQIRHFTHVDDVVNANFLMANLNIKETNGKTFQCVSDVSINILDLCKLIHKLMNKKIQFIFSEERPGDIKCFNINNKQLKNLQFTFKNDFEKELNKTIASYIKVFHGT